MLFQMGKHEYKFFCAKFLEDVCYCTMYYTAVVHHRDLGAEERLDDLYGKVRQLEKQNTTLKSKVRDLQYRVHMSIYCMCIL